MFRDVLFAVLRQLTVIGTFDETQLAMISGAFDVAPERVLLPPGHRWTRDTALVQEARGRGPGG